MKARLIQTDKVDDANRAEKEMLQFLRELPEHYTVFRELQVSAAYQNRVKGMSKAQPDFVVLSRDIGLLAIECKDWNLTRNRYTWQDQYTVRRESLPDREVSTVENPAAQADKYRYAFMELLKPTGVWVSSIVAFPRVTRQEFLNKIGDVAVLKNAQSRYLLDFEITIFKEDIDEFFGRPDELLKRIARKAGFNRSLNDSDIDAVSNLLLPNAFRIGDQNQRLAERQRLKMISVQQERWIFDLDQPTSYLLDVAGSGKTNVLVSRAIHLIDQAHKKKQPVPNILLTTYNPNLQRNLERILAGKIKPEERVTRYRSLTIENVEFVMERVAAAGYGVTETDGYVKTLNPRSSDGFRSQLVNDVQAALQDYPDRFRVFDYIFIDEIQDFDDHQLYLIRQLARQNNFFFVGDIGQKIYDRYHDLKRHGFVIDELELPKTYRMYRTPRHIGDLAHRFVRADPQIRSEFEQHGYRQETQFASVMDNAAEFLRVQNDVDAVVERVNDLLAAGRSEDDIMVITSERRVNPIGRRLQQSGVSCSRGQPRQSGILCVVDFMNVKGLEREVVIISGIEDLAQPADQLFVDEVEQLKLKRFARRKIYVALTRATEECIVFYNDPANAFVSELLQTNRQILNKRQGAN